MRVDGVVVRHPARAVLEDWRSDDNEQRPHSKLGWRTPSAFADALRGPPPEMLGSLEAPHLRLLLHPQTKDHTSAAPLLRLDLKRGARHAERQNYR